MSHDNLGGLYIISVVIPTVNRLGPLQRAMRSLARQSFRGFEVIIVNDGGETPARVVENWRTDLDICLINVPESNGVSHARNLGIEAASGEFIAFLDDDDIYLPNHLSLAHQALSQNDLDAVYGGAIVSSTWIEAMPHFAAISTAKDYCFDSKFLLVANYVHTGSLVVKNFAHSGCRFDEGLSHCEDWDMWIALRQDLGYRFSFLGDTTSVYHQVPHRSGAVSTAYQASPTVFTRAREYVYAKWSADDSVVEDYRRWFREFDSRLDAVIARAGAVPTHVFDRALRVSYAGFVANKEAEVSWFDAIFSHP